MNIGPFIMIAYFVIGLVLTFYWFDRDYSAQIKELHDSGEEDKGGVSIVLLGLVLFWPIKLVMNLIKKGKV